MIDRGYVIVCRNERVGRLEIDIIARTGATLVFCEVRARRTDRWGSPAESIAGDKANRIRRAAAGWLAEHKPRTSRIRFDAAAVVMEGANGEPEVTYYENAF